MFDDVSAARWLAQRHKPFGSREFNNVGTAGDAAPIARLNDFGNLSGPCAANATAHGRCNLCQLTAFGG
jgi:hypothetical protein